MIAFVSYALFGVYGNQEKQAVQKKHQQFLVDCQNHKEILQNFLNIEPVELLPQVMLQGWFEVLRSFFSGMGKGTKAVDYLTTPLLIEIHDDHFIVSIISALVHSIIFALRAYARGFSNIDSGLDESEPRKKIPEKGIPPTSSGGKSGAGCEPHTDFPDASGSSLVIPPVPSPSSLTQSPITPQSCRYSFFRNLKESIEANSLVACKQNCL